MGRGDIHANYPPLKRGRGSIAISTTGAQEKPMEKISVLIADDAEEIREYFAAIIRKEADMEVAALAGSGEEAVAKARELNPGIILMDIQMETRVAGLDAVQLVREHNPAIKVIILTIHNRDDLIFKAYTAGAMDYIIKTSPVDDILKSIRAAHTNSLMLRPEIANKIMEESQRISEKQGKMKEVLKVMMMISNTEFETITTTISGGTSSSYIQFRTESSATVYISEISISADGNTPKVISKNIELTSLDYTFTELISGEEYAVYVVAQNENGDKSYKSNIVYATPTTASAIEEVNPDSGEIISSQYYSLSGKIVPELQQPGIYIKRSIYSTGLVKTEKVIRY